jgi:archaemetzincin
LKERNPVTDERRTIYVVQPPSVAEETQTVQAWAEPASKPTPARPQFQDVVDYLKAFYHGLPVKVLETPRLQFIAWDQPPGKRKPDKKGPGSLDVEIGLADGATACHIRHRQVPNGIYPVQLNLNDILDVAIDLVPGDAYALLMLVDHDLYEDKEDDFCCGRAYGGS